MVSKLAYSRANLKMLHIVNGRVHIEYTKWSNEGAKEECCGHQKLNLRFTIAL